jgi:uncharacterized protein with beta-barrel porin domain
MRTMLWRGMASIAALLLACAHGTAEAADFLVGSQTDFQSVIAAINASAGGEHRIILQQDFYYDSPPAFNFAGTVEIVGGGHTINSGDFDEFYIHRGTVRLENLTLNDSSPHQVFKLHGSGTLGGNATIHGHVENHARISPGSTPGEIGTLRIEGFYEMQDSAAVYEVDLDAGGRSDWIEVSHTASLAHSAYGSGNLLVRGRPGTYIAGRRYTILTAGLGVSGTFDEITAQGLPAFWTVRAEYDGISAYLVLVEGGVTQFASTPNQVQASRGVMSSIFTGDASLNNVFDAMERMTGNEKRAALDQLGGEVYASLSSVGLQHTSNWLGSVGNRLRPTGSAYRSIGIARADGSLRDPGADSPTGDASIRLVSYNPAFGFSSPTTDLETATPTVRTPATYLGWTGGYGAAGGAPGDGNAQGLDYRFAGTSFGVDRYLGEGTVVGVACGYSGTHAEADNLLQEADVNSYQAALYGGRVGDRFYAFNVLSYGFNDYKTARRLPVGLTARGNYAGDEFSDYLEAGLLLPEQERTWQPSLNLQYIGLRHNAFTETGAGGAGLAVGSHVDHSLRPGAALRLVSPTTLRGVTLIPDFHVRYAFEVLDVDRVVTANFSGVAGSTFTTAGNRLGRHFGQFGVGLNAPISRRFSCYGGYDLMMADLAISHAGSGGLQLLW